MEGLDGNKIYAQSLANEYHILALQEHWLYGFEAKTLKESFPEHKTHARYGDQELDEFNLDTPRRKGGVAILWKREIDKYVHPIPDGSGRLTAITIDVPGFPKSVIINTYMPANGSENHLSLYRQLVDEVHELSQKYPLHQLIWLGDLNGSLIRSNNQQDRILQDFIKETALIPTITENTPTYHHFRGNVTSQIDYILISTELSNLSRKSDIKERQTLNVSSHDPVVVNFALTESINSQRKKPPKMSKKVNWNKMDLYEYQESTHLNLTSLEEQADLLSPEELMINLQDILTCAAEKATPPQKASRPARKTPWTPRMSQISKERKLHFWKWKKEGRPKTESSQTYRNLCQSRKLLRQEQRQLASRIRRDKEDKIMQSDEGDRRLFYKLINMQRGTKTDLPDEMVINGKSVTGQTLIDDLTTYFEDLATPQNLQQYDPIAKERNDHTNVLLQQTYRSSPVRILPPVTPQLVLNAMSSLNRGKAPDPEGLMIEHFTKASPIVANILAKLFNTIIQKQQVPQALKHGVITPVFKKKNSPKNPDNYRRITITMVVNKILEKILLDPLKDILAPSLNTLQRGFTPGTSSTNAALLLSEVIAEAGDNKEPLYTLYLDASKAFDVVYHNGMLNQLHAMGIPGDLWMLLNDSYAGMTSALKWDGQLSRKFQEGQGLRQGGLPSTENFKARTDPLLWKLERSGLGAHIGSTYVGAPTCADDIALLSSTHLELQAMAHTAADEASIQRYQYSSSKSKVMLTGKADPKPIEMNTRTVEYSILESHLGIKRTNDTKTNEAVQDRIKAAQRSAYALLGAGMYGMQGLHPKTTLKLIMSYIIPTLTYGLEVLSITSQNLQKLEVFFRNLLRRTQNLPKETASCALHILTGTTPIEAYIDSQVLNLFIRILNLGEAKEKDILQRQLALKDLDSLSWTQKVRKTLHKYHLPSAFDLLEKPPYKSHWKRQVHHAIATFWTHRLTQQAEEKKTLSLLNPYTYTLGSLHPVWNAVETHRHDILQGQIKARILVGRYTLQEDMAKYKNSDPTCLMCHMEQENLHHFVLKCPALETPRVKHITRIQKQLTAHLGEEFAEQLTPTSPLLL